MSSWAPSGWECWALPRPCHCCSQASRYPHLTQHITVGTSAEHTQLPPSSGMDRTSILKSMTLHLQQMLLLLAPVNIPTWGHARSG